MMAIDEVGILTRIAEAIKANGANAEVTRRGLGILQVFIDGINCVSVSEINTGWSLRSRGTSKAEVRDGSKDDGTSFARTLVFKETAKTLNYAKIAEAAIAYAAATKQADARNEEMRVVRDSGRAAASRLKAKHHWAANNGNPSLDKIDLHFRQLTEEQADAILKAVSAVLTK